MATATTDQPYEFLKLSQVVQEFNLGYSSLRAWIDSGRLPAFRVADGNRLRVRRSDVEALLKPVVPKGEST